MTIAYVLTQALIKTKISDKEFSEYFSLSEKGVWRYRSRRIKAQVLFFILSLGKVGLTFPEFSATQALPVAIMAIDTPNIKSIETKMKMIFKKVFKISFLAFLAAVLTIVTIVLFPQQLFAYKMNYKRFTVYSTNKIDNNIKTVLDNAMTLVEKSELYNFDYRYKIILCYNTLYDKIDSKLLGNGPTARTTLNNIVIKVNFNAEKNLAFPTFHKACKVNLTELLAHEMTHCLQADKYGIFKFNPFKHPEFWKLEGYPEYVSKQAALSNKDYSLQKDIDTFARLKNTTNDIWIKEGDCEVPDYYYKGKLMMKYLIDIKHLTYDQILKDTTSENTIYEEMIKWSDNIKNIAN